jgi:nucleoside-diphosphate-sugar epimerase
MKIIVTGALGHIGSKLIRDLPIYFKEPDIIMIDNLTTQRFTSLFNLPKNNANYKFFYKDITKDDLNLIFQNADIVIHLAALTEATASVDSPEEYEKVNYLGTKNILDLCKKNSVKVIHFSSTSIYGTKKEIVDEDCDMDDINPQSPYAATKLKEEILVKNYYENYGVKATTLRLGSICGISPGMRFHAAISKFCFQASTGQSITVWKTAINQKRPYLNLNDAIKAIAFIIKNNLFDGEVFNLVTSNLSVQEIINIIKKFEPKFEIKLVKSKIMNGLSYNVSSQKIITKGFFFSKNVEQGIKDTIGLFKSISH